MQPTFPCIPPARQADFDAHRYGTPHVAELADVDVLNLRHLIRVGHFPPGTIAQHTRGQPRQYGLREMAQAATMRFALAAGLTAPQAARVTPFVPARGDVRTLLRIELTAPVPVLAGDAAGLRRQRNADHFRAHARPVVIGPDDDGFAAIEALFRVRSGSRFGTRAHHGEQLPDPDLTQVILLDANAIAARLADACARAIAAGATWPAPAAAPPQPQSAERAERAPIATAAGSISPEWAQSLRAEFGDRVLAVPAAAFFDAPAGGPAAAGGSPDEDPDDAA